MASLKEQLENEATQQATNQFLLELYEACFTDDERELFEASWKIHNWNDARGLNPSELKVFGFGWNELYFRY